MHTESDSMGLNPEVYDHDPMDMEPGGTDFDSVSDFDGDFENH